MPVIDIDAFLAVADKFKLGDLDTENCNPRTRGLSDLAKSDLEKAIAAIKDVDLAALRAMLIHIPRIQALADAIESTFQDGNRVFLFGCGATGRLSLSLEWLCRSGLLLPELNDRVVAFMSGGDAALIHSIEAFEDFPDYGARQLAELGFAVGDLLISTTEGGETPIVIGCTESAACYITEINETARKPWFIYCNPTELLRQKVDRSKRIIDNNFIEKICIATGPQALSGSTRMQASTVLMMAVGMALRHSCRKDAGNLEAILKQFITNYEKVSLNFLAEFIKFESNLYQEGNQVIYQTEHFGMTVLTDTTERSPTFALSPYENVYTPSDPSSLCYLVMKNANNNAADALRKLLLRDPRPLEWDFCKRMTGLKRILGFDLSQNIIEYRTSRFPDKKQVIFNIDWDEVSKSIEFHYDQNSESICMDQFKDNLQVNLILKMILNIHSTLVMGRIGRYESNVMTYVRPSNYKLIDRSIRYINQILEEKFDIIGVSYSFVAKQLAETYAAMAADEPVVLKTVEAIVRDRQINTK